MSARLEITHLHKRFGGLVAVNDVSFTLEPGEVVGLLGPNGSGKTTVMNMISGALPCDGGTVRVGGTDITKMKPHRVAKHGVARTFQLVRPLPTLSVAQNVLLSLAFGHKRHWGQEARDLAEEKLAFVGLAGRGDERVENLTYIDQKRMEMARALASEPDILLLDEWLAGLNPSELRIGIDLVQHLQRTGDHRLAGGTYHGGRAGAVFALHRDERRPKDCRGRLCRGAARPRCHQGLSGRRSCLNYRM